MSASLRTAVLVLPNARPIWRLTTAEMARTEPIKLPASVCVRLEKELAALELYIDDDNELIDDGECRVGMGTRGGGVRLPPPAMGNERVFGRDGALREPGRLNPDLQAMMVSTVPRRHTPMGKRLSRIHEKVAGRSGVDRPLVSERLWRKASTESTGIGATRGNNGTIASPPAACSLEWCVVVASARGVSMVGGTTDNKSSNFARGAPDFATFFAIPPLWNESRPMSSLEGSVFPMTRTITQKSAINMVELVRVRFGLWGK